MIRYNYEYEVYNEKYWYKIHNVRESKKELKIRTLPPPKL